ncbi:bifunctional glutathionylspermidine amidase/synthase [Pseudohongiella nitratireducens]|uniref:bifunctional glutathionylspermidine amidase/synthase n=1 Tax=Pseudohongiella nitratireducens TaxID=1768907 RepID=UPI0030EEDE05
METSSLRKEKFGTVLGLAPGNVPAYSCDYQSASDEDLPTRKAYRSEINGVYLGHKWQCVEFARRWLYLNHGYVFDDIAMAHDIFRLTSVLHVADKKRLPLHSFKNGCKRHPTAGSLLIYEEGGEFEMTGHVAVITEVSEQFVRLAEQNVGDWRWPEGCNYSRQIKAMVTDDGDYWLECSFGDATILGWVMQTDDASEAEIIEAPSPELFNLQANRANIQQTKRYRAWLNMANADEAAYVAMMKGHRLAASGQDDLFYIASETAMAELQRASNELHALYMHATEYVLKDDSLLRYFNIPEVLWSRIRQSWNNRRNQMITGRFDFSLSEKGLKTYEYNCDSAACYMETGKVQGRWAKHFACNIGANPGKQLHKYLRKAWKNSDVDGLIHIMQDDDPEETYHALFMREAMEEAGIPSKILYGVEGLNWAPDGSIVDADGTRIRWVWKTWAWETALDQIREECNNDAAQLERYQPGEPHSGSPRLIDVLLRGDVMVYEPLWTLIPSNKAISPVLWQLFPEYPYLLESAFELTASLTASGYAIKPIVGRGGANITLLNQQDKVMASTKGKFDSQDQIYQQFFPLPRIAEQYVQVSTFTVAGRYAGASVRVDPTPVIGMNSDCLCLRVVEDDHFLRML